MYVEKIEPGRRMRNIVVALSGNKKGHFSAEPHCCHREHPWRTVDVTEKLQRQTYHNICVCFQHTLDIFSSIYTSYTTLLLEYITLLSWHVPDCTSFWDQHTQWAQCVSASLEQDNCICLKQPNTPDVAPLVTAENSGVFLTVGELL